MFPFAGRTWFLAALTALSVVAPARGDKLTKAEIGKLGKAATAFVDVPGHGSGTAFCIHSSGLFVTNEHVIRGKDKAEIKVVLDAGMKTQRVFTATVVRTDKVRDLALLRVNTKDTLPSLALGSVEGVTELMDVVAFGFPLGAAMSPDRKEYPAMSVNAGSVSALRLKEGELAFIQVDVSVTFGSSGGPVLDEYGKVIGVIVSGVPGQRGINLAIPVSHLIRFLEAPDIQFTPPTLMRETLSKPTEFKAKVVSVLPGAKEPSLKLILLAGDETAREFPMTAKDGAFVATAPPALKSGSGRVEVSIRLGAGMISGLMDDLVFKVAGNPVKLSRIKRLDLKPKAVVLMADGKSVEGEVTGLGSVELLLGDEKIKLDLAKAIQIQVTPAAEIGTVVVTIVASANGKEVGRLEVPIDVRDVSRLAPVDPKSVRITPPALSENRVVKRLPEPFADVCLGGGGRYLVFHLPRVHKLAVFDINEARITNYVPLTEDKITFSAGLDSLVIGLPGEGVVERWRLSTAERETSVAPALKERNPIQRVILGHGSNGPLAINGFIFDLGTLKPLPILENNGNVHIWADSYPLVASADGTVFGGDHSTWVLEGDRIANYNSGGDVGYLVPGHDGKKVFSKRGVLSSNLKKFDAEYEEIGRCIPAVQGDYFLCLNPATGGKKGNTIAIHLLGQQKPFARLDEAGSGITFGEWEKEESEVWKRLYFVPQANAIIVLPTTNDQVVIYKFDADAALEKSDLDYLLVKSQPSRTVKAGATYGYTLAVKAKRTPVSFKLDSGPKGMEVSKEGVVTWKAPADVMGDQDVILTVRDASGQEIFHTFAVRVVK